MTASGRAWAAAGVTVCLWLAACASYRPAPLSPGASAAALEARSLDDPRLRHFIAATLGDDHPGAPWGLARLTLAAVYYHPDLEIARARVGAAEATVTTARQRPNPTFDLAAVFGTGAATGAIPAAAAPLTIGPVVNFVIETAGKREYRGAAARHLADAARANLVAAAWQVRGGVRTALLAVWASQRRMQLLRRRLALQDELTSLLQARRAAGISSSLDVSRERIRRGEFALAVRDGERALADARARLASAIGVPLAALDGTGLSFDAFERPPALPADPALGDLRHRALTRRSDIAAALARYEATQSQLQLAIAGQYPNVTLGPGYQYDFGVNKYLLGPSLVLPIFNQNQGPIAEAAAARKLAAAQFDALQTRVVGAIDRAAADYRASAAAAAAGTALAADARQREQQMHRALQAGRIDRPTLVESELEAAAAELAHFDAALKQMQALSSLEDALQYPLFGPPTAFLSPAAEPRPATGPGA